ncbi:MAG TPA: hypothetical protein VD908_20145 [Cytophagales bacterium]|nr:hypothetical protein [Cytophagales bacterium]
MENIDKENTPDKTLENNPKRSPEEKAGNNTGIKNRDLDEKDPKKETAPSSDLITNTGDDSPVPKGDADAATG